MEFSEQEKEKLIREAGANHVGIIKVHPWLLFGLLFILAGCGRVGFEVETVVHEDGSFDRTVTYTTRASDREMLAKEYQLPAGAGWEVTETTQLSGPSSPNNIPERLFVYRARGTFRSLETDYAKEDYQTPPSFSKNRISIRAAPDLYEYLETFSDTANVAELRRLGERFVEELVEKAIAECKKDDVLSQESPAVIETIQRRVTTSALGYFDQVWHKLETAEAEEDLEPMAVLTREGEEFLISQIDRWWRSEGRHYPGPDARKRIVQVLTKSSEGESHKDEKPYEPDLARYGGAYSPSWPRSYDFKVTVSMPTDIAESNADHVKGNVATWEFDPLIFLLKDYTLVAKAKREGGK